MTNQKAIEVINNRDQIMGYCESEKLSDALDLAVEALRIHKKGHWLKQKISNCHAILMCSECGRLIEPTFDFGLFSMDTTREVYPFCHCGADMREDEDE